MEKYISDSLHARKFRLVDYAVTSVQNNNNNSISIKTQSRGKKYALRVYVDVNTQSRGSSQHEACQLKVLRVLSIEIVVQPEILSLRNGCKMAHKWWRYYIT